MDSWVNEMNNIIKKVAHISLYILSGLFLFSFADWAAAAASELSYGTGSSGSLDFTPPLGDYSVIFLGNMFGIVDGVLHGSGSQIMGAMFGVFNSAVLALGGIIIMYTLTVGTMNTAHEGQMLGQKFSSIWVPLRSTLGMALLIPKASGYCAIQIFVMWVTVQGVGAADKLWNAALNYLNRGGVIVATQVNPITNIQGVNNEVYTGATTILAGQVCMLGIEKLLKNQREHNMQLVESKAGNCYRPSPIMDPFCKTIVPDFIGSVNTVSAQQQSAPPCPSSTKVATGNYCIPMPSFDSSSPYASLNGICGTIQWSPIAGLQNIQQTLTNLNSSDVNTAQLSRAIAIQQMYMDLASIAKTMISNDPDPGLAPIPYDQNSPPVPPPSVTAVAKNQFGIPILSTGTPCSEVSIDCTGWGVDPAYPNSTPIFNGNELSNAIADYNGIMAPTLNLLIQSMQSNSTNARTSFISQAEQQGWIMAGSYFFNLARINDKGNVNAGFIDSGTGLTQSEYPFDNSIPNILPPSGCGTSSYANLCYWLDGDSYGLPVATAKLNTIPKLVEGAGMTSNTVSPNTAPLNHNAVSGQEATTVYGFITNQSLVNLPGQPGLVPPAFAMHFNLNVQTAPPKLPTMNFPCGRASWFTGCIGSALANIMYNVVIVNVYNKFVSMVVPVLNQVIISFLELPLSGIAQIFHHGVSFIQQPNVNPIVALANMGINYINFASQLWIYLIIVAIGAEFLPMGLGIFLFALLGLAMPMLMAWLATMVTIGFMTAYYIPFLPYMIFTFGSIAWLMAVIEAMVAAPIVAIGITSPEGHDAFGKGEHAIMILMNVFLRPAMMVIGYIAAIALSYVAVWIINAGFSNALLFIQGVPSAPPSSTGAALKTAGEQLGQGIVGGGGGVIGGIISKIPGTGGAGESIAEHAAAAASSIGTNQPALPTSQAIVNQELGPNAYTGWASIYGLFFSVLIYTWMYWTVVEKAFELIAYLPDKVLRWIGGQPETIGSEATHWVDQGKKQVSEAGEKTEKAQAQMGQQLTGYAKQAMTRKPKGGGKVEGS